MLSWSARRRLIYTIGTLLPIFIIIMTIFFFVWYEKPTCFDGKQNGDELGVDCGGGCEILCPNQAIDAEILWSRAFEILPGVYNLVSYIENPNIGSRVDYAPYRFVAYDSNNNVLVERRGVASIPERNNFVVFEGTVRTEGKKISRTVFSFTQKLDWKISDDEPIDIEVKNTTLVGTETMPRITTTLKNNSLFDFREVEVPVIVFDSEGNAINASRTLIDNFIRETERDLVFTWPEPFEIKEEVCSSPSDIALVIDRSGSMNDDNIDPPEPLNSVKEAAKSFVSKLQTTDVVSVVSFANEAIIEMGSPISAIEAIEIGPDENNQNTNIYDGLKVSFEKLSGEGDRNEADNVIILLTDGIATRPLESGNPKFAEEIAMKYSENIRLSNTDLYVIGLGESVNEEYLGDLSTGEGYYYSSPTNEDLDAIYEEIAMSICKKGPNVIQIIPRVVR